MISCTFDGHLSTRMIDAEEQIWEVIEKILKLDTEFSFYIGSINAFERKCVRIVQEAMDRFPELNIQMYRVMPYIIENGPRHGQFVKFALKPEDEIIADRTGEVFRLTSLNKRNRWMLDRVDYLISCTRENGGGAHLSIKYAERKGIKIIDITEPRENDIL